MWTISVFSPLFVTWKKVVNGAEPRLRGCIGTLEAQGLISGFKDYALTRYPWKMPVHRFCDLYLLLHKQHYVITFVEHKCFLQVIFSFHFTQLVIGKMVHVRWLQRKTELAIIQYQCKWLIYLVTRFILCFKLLFMHILYCRIKCIYLVNMC